MNFVTMLVVSFITCTNTVCQKNDLFSTVLTVVTKVHGMFCLNELHVNIADHPMCSLKYLLTYKTNKRNLEKSMTAHRTIHISAHLDLNISVEINETLVDPCDAFYPLFSVAEWELGGVHPFLHPSPVLFLSSFTLSHPRQEICLQANSKGFAE